MKRKDLIRLLERSGWWFKREGGNHDITPMVRLASLYPDNVR